MGFGMSTQHTTTARLVKCRVTVKTEDGEITYDGLFPSTFDAREDAEKCFGLGCRIEVKVAV
jgi:hypothetical protein